MSIKQKPVYVCDFCGAEMGEVKHIVIEDRTTGSISTISNGNLCFPVAESDFCNLDCLFGQIRKHLEK